MEDRGRGRWRGGGNVRSMGVPSHDLSALEDDVTHTLEHHRQDTSSLLQDNHQSSIKPNYTCTPSEELSPKIQAIDEHSAKGKQAQVTPLRTEQSDAFSHQNSTYETPGNENITSRDSVSNGKRKFMGFSTGTGKKIHYSADSLKKAKTILSTEDLFGDFSLVPETQNHQKEKHASSSSSRSGVFSTANHSMDAVQDTEESGKSVEKQDEVPNFCGFVTAKGQKVKISEDSLKKASRLLSRDSSKENETTEASLQINAENQMRETSPNRVITRGQEKSSKFSGITTAKGKNVDDDPNKKARTLLPKSASSKSSREAANSSTVRHDTPEKFSNFSGFTTARGNRVDISEEHLERARNSFSNRSEVKTESDLLAVEKDDSSQKNIQETQKVNQDPKTPSNFYGFSEKSLSETNKKQNGSRLSTNLLGQNGTPDNIFPTIMKKQILQFETPQHPARRSRFRISSSDRGTSYSRTPQVDAGFRRNLLSLTPFKTPERFNSQTGITIHSRLEARQVVTPLKKKIANKRKSFIEGVTKTTLLPFHSLEELEQEFKIPLDVCLVNSLLAVDYAFSEQGYREAYNHLLSRKGNPSFLSLKWVKNHYRWIVWKMASLVRRYPRIYHSYFNFNQVLVQLENRFESEFELVRASALKQIFQKDNFASRFLILCVAQIRECDGKLCKCLELTDGWYSIDVCPDDALHKLIEKKKIFVGMKLRLFGSVLKGTNEGCDPLDDAKPFLSIHINGTSRSTWDAKLGFQKERGFPVPLNALKPGGGILPSTKGLIQRVYPMCFLERNNEGVKHLRNELAEEFAKDRHLSKLERFSSLLESVRSMGTDRTCKLIESLSQSEQDILEDLSCKLSSSSSSHLTMSELLLSHPNLSRTSSKFLRIDISDISQLNSLPVLIELTLWDPPDDILSRIKEGCVIELFGAQVSSSNILSLSVSCSKGVPLKFLELHSDVLIRRCFYSSSLWQCLRGGEVFDLSGFVLSVSKKDKMIAFFIQSHCGKEQMFLQIDHHEGLQFFRKIPPAGVKIQVSNVKYLGFDSKYSIHQAISSPFTRISYNKEILSKASISPQPPQEWECCVITYGTLDITYSLECNLLRNNGKEMLRVRISDGKKIFVAFVDIDLFLSIWKTVVFCDGSDLSGIGCESCGLELISGNMEKEEFVEAFECMFSGTSDVHDRLMRFIEERFGLYMFQIQLTKKRGEEMYHVHSVELDTAESILEEFESLLQ